MLLVQPPVIATTTQEVLAGLGCSDVEVGGWWMWVGGLGSLLRSLCQVPPTVPPPPPPLLSPQVVSNHGHPQWTCVYRLRVHGRPVDV